MDQSQFSYVAYIGATPSSVWAALTGSEIMKRYWFGIRCESRWTAGATRVRFGPDGTIIDSGEIAAFDAPRRMAIRWRHRKRPELAAEGGSLCTINLEPAGLAVKLSIVHSIERSPSQLIAAVADGWPKVVSNLKSYLESGMILLTSL